jgi:predicted glycoside hydrolase/deacetylase ChbG (UPF0249 family)
MQTRHGRQLLVIADDFGIGPATTAGILRLAGKGVVTGSVLLVNSPYAADAVDAWRRRGCPMDLGWHPNLTLDAPVLPPGRVPSLVGPDGRFWPLRDFLGRWLLGRLDADDIEAELQAQYDAFVDLVGAPPDFVNTHQHVGLFPPVGEMLVWVLRRREYAGYVRRVREPWALLRQVPGARLKRAVLNHLGRRQSGIQARAGFPGNDWLAGITDPPWVRDPQFFARWLACVPGRVVELMCHPGYPDPTVLGRDCEPGDGLLQRRVDEFALLDRPAFAAAVAAAGFEPARPSRWLPTEETYARAA